MKFSELARHTARKVSASYLDYRFGPTAHHAAAATSTAITLYAQQLLQPRHAPDTGICCGTTIRGFKISVLSKHSRIFPLSARVRVFLVFRSPIVSSAPVRHKYFTTYSTQWCENSVHSVSTSENCTRSYHYKTTCIPKKNVTVNKFNFCILKELI